MFIVGSLTTILKEKSLAPSGKFLRLKWLNKISTDLRMLKNPVICIKHFRDSDIINTDKSVMAGELQ